MRRLGHLFLCAAPFLVAAAAAARPLRAAGIHHAAGAVLFAAIAAAVWTLGLRTIRKDEPGRRLAALAGALLVAPFALVALLWVGLGTPWEATPRENQMRYLVLMAMAVAEVGGFVAATEALREAGERLYSAVALAATIVAGPVYFVWNAFMFAVNAARERSGEVPAALVSLNGVLDLLLDGAAVLTYGAAAALAVSLGRAGWLGRGAARASVIVTLVAVGFLAHRGVKFLAPAELSSPWYTAPGFIVGIPAVPYILPFLLGVALLRRAGDPSA